MVMPKSIYQVAKGNIKIYLDNFDQVHIFRDFIGYYVDFNVFNIQRVKYTGKEKILAPKVAVDKVVSHFNLKPLDVHVEEDKEHECTKRVS